MPKFTQVITHSDQITTEWAGGTTTQLAIYPPEALYSDRCFKWRLSTATVSLQESRFTSLPGFRRILMILSGEILLKHENHHEKHLGAFEQDHFDGAWNTTSFGCAVDFNLMMAEGVSGDVAAITLSPGEEQVVVATGETGKDGRSTTIALYVYSGQATLHLAGETYPLDEKDMLLIHHSPTAGQPGLSRHLLSDAPVQIIRAIIRY